MHWNICCWDKKDFGCFLCNCVYIFLFISEILALLLTDVLILMQEKDQKYVFSTMVSEHSNIRSKLLYKGLPCRNAP